MFVEGLQAVGELHQCYPGRLGQLETTLEGPQTSGGTLTRLRMYERG